jgi:hypothetical protein
MTPSTKQFRRGALAALVLIAFATPAPAGAQSQSEPVAGTGASVTKPGHSPAGISPAVTRQANQAAAQAAQEASKTGISDAPAPAARSSASAMKVLPASLGGKAPNPSTASAGPPPKKTLKQKFKAALHKLNPKRLFLDHEYKKAAAAFPTFCEKWSSYLKDREKNNLSHIAWRFENGFQTALYTGYSSIESCQAHQSPGGYALGKLSYEEYHYLIKAKTRDEALKTKAKPIDDTHTTEIFRWDKGKWFY